MLRQRPPALPRKPWRAPPPPRSISPGRPTIPTATACSTTCISVPTIKSSGCRSAPRSEEHTSELQSLRHLVCRLLLEKKTKFIHTLVTAQNLPLPPDAELDIALS